MAERARIVLACLRGKRNDEVASEMGLRPNTVGQWRRRFAERGVAGLRDQPRSGKPAKYGVDPDATYRAIRASSGNSFVHETESQLVLSGSYNVKFTMDLACKDLGLVNGIAEKLGVPLELGSMAQQIFRRARGLMGGGAQSPEVVRMIEKACGLELRAPGYPTELRAEQETP